VEGVVIIKMIKFNLLYLQNNVTERAHIEFDFDLSF